MLHFAQLDENDIVVNIVIADREIIESGILGDKNLFVETDKYTRFGVHYDENNNPDGGTPLRGNYATIGAKYDRENDVFYPHKPFPSWVISGPPDWSYVSPVPKPPKTETIRNSWNEETLTWDQFVIK